MKTIFAEKYRPQTLDDVIGQEHVTASLKGFIQKDKVPHMLFTGPAGTGKTTTAIALAKDLYGESWKDYFLEMNASDDNGIQTIRDKVKSYARIRVVGRKYKIIFMDECDNMTKDAQSALRRIIEMYSDKCRFILSCNYPNKIIDPIKDRCVVFRFKSIKPEDMISAITKIAKAEELNLTEEAKQELGKLSHGSMRLVLNTLYKIKFGEKVPTTISEKHIQKTLCYLNDQDIKQLVYFAKEGYLDKIDAALEDLLYNKGYTTIEIIRALRRLLKESKVLTTRQKVKALVGLGDVDFRIAEGATPDIQLKTYVSSLILLYKEK